MFLVCGEALFDVFVGAESGRGLQLSAEPGGSPFNVALGLARLGQPVQFFGGIARDVLGDRLAAVLEAEGVDIGCCARLEAHTALGLVNTGADGQPEYAFYGHGSADRMLTIDHLPELGECVRAIHIGSFSTIVDPVAHTLDALVRRERERRLIAYDPNVRLNVEPSLERWRARIDTLAGLSHVIKISEEDVQLIYGDADRDALARHWLDAGACLVVVTRGAQGARAWNGVAYVDVDGIEVDVVDTVGAGDTFQAAMLSGLAGFDCLDPQAVAMLDAAALTCLLNESSRAAALTCMRRGADLPRRSELLSASAAAALAALPA